MELLLTSVISGCVTGLVILLFVRLGIMPAFAITMVSEEEMKNHYKDQDDS